MQLWADRLALAYAAFVLLYWLLPQSWLDGSATHRGQLFAARHDLIPVAAYFLGRLLVLTPVAWRRISLALVGVAVALTLWGLADVYLVPLQWWRDSGVPGWFGDQLGLTYHGLSGLPENWVFNTGDENNPIRRLVSGFLSPLATAYVLVIVLLYLVARRRTWWTVTAGLDRLRRPSLDAHAGGVPRSCARVGRARSRAAPAPSGLAGDRLRSWSASPSCKAFPQHRPVDELHAGGARRPPQAGTAESRV